MTVVTLAEAKARFAEIADEVIRTHDRVGVTRDGSEIVVIVAAADLESLEATLELLSDPGAIADLGEAERQIAEGDTISLEAMRALMDERSRNADDEQHEACR